MTSFSALVALSAQVAATSKRNEKVTLLAAYLTALERSVLDVGVSYLVGELRQGKIGIAYASVRETAAVNPAKDSTLTLQDVDRALESIGAMSGSGSVIQKKAALHALLARACIDEQDFLRRLLVGELRQGALESLFIDAIAKASGIKKARVRRAQMIAADLSRVAAVSLFEGESALCAFDVVVMRPLQPMLAQTAESVVDGFARLDAPIAELKLDGARVQVHKSGSDVAVFTRKLNDVSAAVPEIIDEVRALEADTLILDGETIALKPDGTPYPFQTTMRRFGRKLDVDKLTQTLPLSTFYFDCLELNGTSLIDLPQSSRWQALCDVVPAPQRIPRLRDGDVAAVSAFLTDALARGHEGIIFKSPTAPYEAGARGAGWLKLKHVHTLDLVVLGAEWGSGRRSGWLSNLHLGARSETDGEFVMLGKTFKGLTDRVLAWQTEALLHRETHRDEHVVFVRPELVVEIAFNDVQTSPHYPGGVALRFARVKGYRPDKAPAQADTIESVLALRNE